MEDFVDFAKNSEFVMPVPDKVRDDGSGIQNKLEFLDFPMPFAGNDTLKKFWLFTTSSSLFLELKRQVVFMKNTFQIRTHWNLPCLVTISIILFFMIQYLHHPVVLNYHYYLSDENILNISADTEVVLAEYKTDNQFARLLLIKYPMSEKAAQSQDNFLNHYLPDADKNGATLLENGKWAAIHIKGHLLAIVLKADSKEFAERLLKNIQ